jgi:ABC-2 type transport system ATP-binding protein
MLLAVENLSVRYGRRVAVDGLTFSVDAGEIVGLLGPNGAGKSSALAAIAGAVEPAAGRALVDGQPAVDARAKVGLADQPPTLYEFLTVDEHLAFVRDARGGAPEPALLEELGLAPVAGQLCRELSFGYRQRVGLAAALIGGTRAILLDETLNGLDPHAARRARAVLQAAAARGAGVLMSTHLLAVAERLCTRVLVLDKGKLVRDVPTAELEALVANGPGALEELYLSLVAEEPAA